MGQIILPERIGELIRVSDTQIALKPSIINIGGQQYRTNSNIYLNVSGLTANTLYFVYAYYNNGIQLMVDISDDLEFSQPVKKVGMFNTNSSGTMYYIRKENNKDTPPPGHVIAHTSNTIPMGWLLCDGSAISRSVYADLFAVVGTTYGSGDGTLTFNIPDLRGRSIISSGTGVGLSPRTLGQYLGAETHTLSINEMPSHTHGPGTVGSFANGGNAWGAQTTTNYNYWAFNSNYNFNETGSRGGSQAHNNMQPSLVINYIIKY